MMKYIGIPAFITADQEGGMVTRLYNGATVFPGAMTLSATNNLENAYLSGLYMAKELDALGINVNFAPVLDVNNNPLNPVIGEVLVIQQRELVYMLITLLRYANKSYCNRQTLSGAW